MKLIKKSEVTSSSILRRVPLFGECFRDHLTTVFASNFIFAFIHTHVRLHDFTLLKKLNNVETTYRILNLPSVTNLTYFLPFSITLDLGLLVGDGGSLSSLLEFQGSNYVQPEHYYNLLTILTNLAILTNGHWSVTILITLTILITFTLTDHIANNHPLLNTIPPPFTITSHSQVVEAGPYFLKSFLKLKSSQAQ